MRFSTWCVAPSKTSTQSQPIFIHSSLIEGELRKVTSKQRDKLWVGEMDCFTDPQLPWYSHCIYFIFLPVSEFFLCPGMTNGRRKVSMPWNLKQAESLRLSSLPTLQWKSIPVDNCYFFYFVLKHH